MSWQRARRVRGFDALFGAYVRRLVRRNFAAVWLRRGSTFPPGGYIAAANHRSWWDGFIPYVLHRQAAPAQPFAIMMSDAELRRFPYFRFAGAFSVDAASPRAALPAIVYAADEARSGAAVWIFPEGALQPPAAPLVFTSGFVHAARRAGAPIVPVAMRFVVLDTQRPHAFVAAGPAIAPAAGAQRKTEDAVSGMLAAIDADIGERRIATHYERVLRGARGADERAASALRLFRR